MNELNYEKFYDKVGKLNGWDFRGQLGIFIMK